MFTIDLYLLNEAQRAQQYKIDLQQKTKDAMMIMSYELVLPVALIARFGTHFVISNGSETWSEFSSAGHKKAGRSCIPARHPGEMKQMRLLAPLKDSKFPRELLAILHQNNCAVNYRDPSKPLTGKKISKNLASYYAKETKIAEIGS
jgi:hypothetical protein